MKYKAKDVLEFAKLHINQFDERMEVFMTKPEDLISKKVISIRSGFSGGSGQIMIISEADETNIHFTPCDESHLPYSQARENHLGWSTRYAKRADDFIFYNKE